MCFLDLRRRQRVRSADADEVFQQHPAAGCNSDVDAATPKRLFDRITAQAGGGGARVGGRHLPTDRPQHEGDEEGRPTAQPEQ